MAEQYTPTTEEVRAAWQESFNHPGSQELGQQFDRFLAQVRAEALRGLSEKYGQLAANAKTDGMVSTEIQFRTTATLLAEEALHIERVDERIADTNQQDRSAR